MILMIIIEEIHMKKIIMIVIKKSDISNEK